MSAKTSTPDKVDRKIGMVSRSVVVAAKYRGVLIPIGRICRCATRETDRPRPLARYLAQALCR